MEAIIYVVLIYGGFALLGWIFGQIGKWNDERKSNIRDEVAREVLPKTRVSDETIQEYKDKLAQIGYTKSQGYGNFWKDIMSDGLKSYRGLIEKCPLCNEGSLRIIKGQYGKFLGCSSYPKCRYTKNLDVAKKEYKEKSNKEFMELFHLAYK